jgi:hypothetical protein
MPAGLLGERGTFSPAGQLHHIGPGRARALILANPIRIGLGYALVDHGCSGIRDGSYRWPLTVTGVVPAVIEAI